MASYLLTKAIFIYTVHFGHCAHVVIDKTSLPVQWCGFAVASQSRPLLKSLRSPQTDPHREQDPGSRPSLTHCCSLLWQDKPETILLLRKKLLMQHHTKNP